MSVSIEIKRDAKFARLARKLRYEAKLAAVGKAVDDMTGIPEGKDYGSHHEYMLKTSSQYREDFAMACRETADKSELRAEFGEPTKFNEAPISGTLTPIRDPITGGPTQVRRVLENTPLNRARYFNADPIAELQWLAGIMFEADCAGDVPYNGNAASIAANGVYRARGEGVSRHLQARHPVALIDGEELAVAKFFDGGRELGDDEEPSNANELGDAPTNETQSSARRLAKVQRDLKPNERNLARLWLIEHNEPTNRAAFVALLTRLANLYSAHDRDFSGEENLIHRYHQQNQIVERLKAKYHEKNIRRPPKRRKRCARGIGAVA